ncbi:MAG TPA: hypothetical protein ENJ30_13790 [Desulfobulbaceae bacterium]|nr:hypothetical protein [Desulfobulbaceae bacterium]
MKRISAGLLVFLITGMILFSANETRAKEYLGFSPGVQSWDEVELTLKTAHAVYETNYSYQGYANILPVIKVNSYKKFNKFGQVKESWLDFTPDRKLYRISVTWEHADKTFKILKDALDTKYGQPAIPGGIGNRGFRKEYRYEDREIGILLKFDEFGFEPTTSLIYTYTPATPQYEKGKKMIEDDIKKINAQKAGSDL